LCDKTNLKQKSKRKIKNHNFTYGLHSTLPTFMFEEESGVLGSLGALFGF
jgi:hypothetical protein